MSEQQKRENIIVRTSVIGITVNLMLAAFKAAVGLISNSIAVVLDAVNNLSDALSSIITIIGAKVAGKSLIRTILWDTDAANTYLHLSWPE